MWVKNLDVQKYTFCFTSWFPTRRQARTTCARNTAWGFKHNPEIGDQHNWRY